MRCSIASACQEDFIFIVSPAISRGEGGREGGREGGKTQPDVTWRTRHQLRPSKETMDNSLFVASVHGAGRQQAACIVFTVEPP